MKRVCVIFIAVTLTLSLLTGCAGSPAGDALSARYNTDSATGNERLAAESAEMHSYSMTAGNAAPPDIARKVIFNYYHGLETKDMEVTLAVIEQATAFSGGYIENSSYSDRGSGEQFSYARLICRIPVDNAGGFKSVVENSAHVRSKTEQGQDVTDEYFDAGVRVATLTTQEARLLEMLRHSDVLVDLLELERELARVRTEIERLTGRLRLLDNQVALATFTIDIWLVAEYTENEEPGFIRTMGNAVTGSLGTAAEVVRVALIVLIYALPYLIVVCAGAAAVFLIRRGRKKDKKKTDMEIEL
jgi:hypothetical protein